MLKLQTILICVAAIAVAGGGAAAWIWNQGASHVHSQVAAQVAHAATDTAHAETQQHAHAARRIDDHAVEIERLRTETENARQTIADAPDLDTSVAAATAFAERVRTDTAAGRAAAVRDYNSSLDPDTG